MTIGNCDNCDRRHVPVIHFTDTYCGDTTQCFLCQGDTDPDPFGEMDDYLPAPAMPPIMAQFDAAVAAVKRSVEGAKV